MDRTLLERSIKHHGIGLLEFITEEQGRRHVPRFSAGLPSPNSENIISGGGRAAFLHQQPSAPSASSYSQCSDGVALPGLSSDAEDYDDRNEGTAALLKKQEDPSIKLRRFIAQKADILFNSESAVRHRVRSVAQYTIDDFMPPLESFMGVRNSRLQRELFFDQLTVGDVFYCNVTSVHDSGLNVLLLCHARSECREIDHLKVPAFYSNRCLPGAFSDAFTVRDKVKGVVTSLNRSTESIQMSMVERDLPDALQGQEKLGLVSKEEFPQFYRSMCASEGQTYEQVLTSNEQFKNSSCIKSLCQQLGIQEGPKASLMRSIVNYDVPSTERAPYLRQQQSKIHALQSVMEGVKLYKEGNQTGAAVCYNRALDVDPDNVEALVARGAMYANNDSYRRALDDFKLALKINPDHQNATDYMVQTLMAYGKESEEIKNDELAIDCFCQVLLLQPVHEGAAQALRHIKNKARASSPEQEQTVTSTRPDEFSPEKDRRRSHHGDSPHSNSNRRSRGSSRSPQRGKRSQSSRDERSRSPKSRRSKSSKSNRSRSPRKRNSRSPRNMRSRSPRKRNSRSPRNMRSRSPQKRKSRSPERSKSSRAEPGRSNDDGRSDGKSDLSTQRSKSTDSHDDKYERSLEQKSAQDKAERSATGSTSHHASTVELKETTSVRSDEMMRKQKQIDYMKATETYEFYVKKIPKRERNSDHPRTPRINQQVSRRGWDGMVKAWKLRIHRLVDEIDKKEENDLAARQHTEEHEFKPSTDDSEQKHPANMLDMFADVSTTSTDEKPKTQTALPYFLSVDPTGYKKKPNPGISEDTVQKLTDRSTHSSGHRSTSGRRSDQHRSSSDMKNRDDYKSDRRSSTGNPKSRSSLDHRRSDEKSTSDSRCSTEKRRSDSRHITEASNKDNKSSSRRSTEHGVTEKTSSEKSGSKSSEQSLSQSRKRHADDDEERGSKRQKKEAKPVSFSLSGKANLVSNKTEKIKEALSSEDLPDRAKKNQEDLKKKDSDRKLKEMEDFLDMLKKNKQK